MNDFLSKKQEEVNKLFEENNYEINDEILDFQLMINYTRNKLDIPDESEMIYENYVQ